MVHSALASMEKHTQFVIDLKGQATETKDYRWTLDDEFFRQVEATEVQRGEVEVQLTVRRTSGAYQLAFQLKGFLVLPCDRCLEDMEQPIETEETLKVKLGDDYDDDGELVTIPYADGKIDLSWHLYEFVVLQIPLRHVHADGECVGDIEKILDNN